MNEPTVVVSPECSYCALGDKPETIENVGTDVHTIYSTCGESPLILAAAQQHAERLVGAHWNGVEECIKGEFCIPDPNNPNAVNWNRSIQRILEAVQRYRDQATF